MTAKKEIAPELMAEARRLYEQTLAPVGDIAEMVGLSRSNFYERVREGGWRSRRAKPSFSFARALCSTGLPVTERADQPHTEPPVTSEPVTAQQRMVMAQRIMRTVEREMDAIDRILQTITPADQLEAEHGARTIASISRALREIAALNRPEDETQPDDAAADDTIPLDIDEFRNELARRINSFIDAKRSGEGGTDREAIGGPVAEGA